MSNRQFKPLKSVEPTDAELEAFAERRGMPSLKAVAKEPERPSEASSQLSKTETVAPRPAVETTRVAFEAPLYLSDQLKRRALDHRCSTRFIMLQALRDAGFEINENDMIADGRRLR